MALKLRDLSKRELEEFFSSFDTVLSDVDGVLFADILHIIDGAKESIKLLRDLKKKLYFISNNSTAPLELYLSRLKSLETKKEEVVRPTESIAWYLKKINFTKELYVIGVKALRDALKQEGLNVVYDEVTPVEETIYGAINIAENLNPNVGAVVIDFSLNITFLQIQRCVEYIRQNNAIFLVGAWDTVAPLGKSLLIGPKLFAGIIEQTTGVSPIVLSKPGEPFQELLKENIGPFDEKRVLFIGDSVETDMIFATNCGFKKLLVLTGSTSEKDLKNWKHDDCFKPNYVADSIKDLFTAASKIGIV
ncbi:uncharacterized protein [Euwallacea fornicatus]|uniref:uncharacterized protein n=1 Tax=Euwallacea fornicatus TaxID=995702 RepID=UPI0033903C0C